MVNSHLITVKITTVKNRSSNLFFFFVVCFLFSLCSSCYLVYALMAGIRLLMVLCPEKSAVHTLNYAVARWFCVHTTVRARSEPFCEGNQKCFKCAGTVFWSKPLPSSGQSGYMCGYESESRESQDGCDVLWLCSIKTWEICAYVCKCVEHDRRVHVLIPNRHLSSYLCLFFTFLLLHWESLFCRCTEQSCCIQAWLSNNKNRNIITFTVNNIGNL